MSLHNQWRKEDLMKNFQYHIELKLEILLKLYIVHIPPSFNTTETMSLRPQTNISSLPWYHNIAALNKFSRKTKILNSLWPLSFVHDSLYVGSSS